MTARAPLVTTATERLVVRLARRLDDGALSRRSFLIRTAIVGSVLTVAPLRWMLRPTSAYASVCGDGASCASGWTAFCCTINDGANTCPPGSYVAGWWKIDRSPFCRDAPRYIVDCNRSPGSSCRCRCASGTCDQRRVCCNNFRYGQCNTQVPGVTEVVCRVVLCTPPWTWDPACGTTLRTDNRTTSHNAPCLPGRDATQIDLRYQDLGQSGSALGRPLAAERAAPRSGAWRRYDGGVIAWRASTGARVLTAAVADRYVALEGPAGPLGYPTSDHQPVADSTGEQVRFERGRILSRGPDAVAVLGPALARFDSLGGVGGVLGFPTHSTSPVGDGRGNLTRFTGGDVYAVGTSAQELLGAVAARYRELGGPTGSGLGYPVGPSDPALQRFSDGLLVAVGARLHAVRGAIARRYLAEGGPEGPWGVPTADEADGVAAFTAVTVFAGERGRAWALDGPVLERYRALGGPGGQLGLPTTDRFRTRSGQDRASFTGGAIVADPATGVVQVLSRRTTRRASELTIRE